MIYKKKPTFVITGGNGFIGRNLYNFLKKRGKSKIISIPRRIDLSKKKQVEKYFKKINKIDYIFHLAEVSGNKEWSKNNSFLQTVTNLNIHSNIISSWKKFHSKARFIFVSSIWSYPLGAPISIEKNYWKGELNPDTRHFGYCKKMATLLIETAKKNYNLKGTTLILGTVYGPGDRSDHFIPTIIRRMRDEKYNLKVFGTGKESRDFIYIDDQIKGIYMHKDKNEEIINIGTGRTTMIKNIINISKKIMKYKGRINYTKNKYKYNDTNRGMSIKKARKLTGWTKINKLKKLEIGLKNTINDMIKNG